MTNLDRKAVQGASAKLGLELARLIGEHKVIDDKDILEGLGGDESHCAPVVPDLAVRPKTEDDVIQVMRLAKERSVPITVRGGGTGKAGGAIPVHGGVVLDMSRMNGLLEIDKSNLLAVVQPGLVNLEFQQAVEAEGLFYPPDPNSLETCTLGGNVAHNAGGPRAFKYGVTRNYVMGLGACLMGGQSISVGGKTIKTVAGYDLTGLLVGSEGTLAVFNRLILRLVRKPPAIATLLVRFDDEVAAGRAISKIIERGLVPRVMEFMDSVMVETLRIAGAGAVPADTRALLLAEVDGANEELVEEEAIQLAEACEEEGASDVLMARHGTEREKLWAARRTLSDAVKQRAAHKVSEDIVVPRSRMSELMSGLQKIGVKNDVLVATYGHAGDGNIHVNVLWDEDGWDPWSTVEDVFRLVLRLEGSITGEHGVGIAKKKYLPWEKSDGQLVIQKQLKSVFDPDGLLNPGKIF